MPALGVEPWRQGLQITVLPDHTRLLLLPSQGGSAEVGDDAPPQASVTVTLEITERLKLSPVMPCQEEVPINCLGPSLQAGEH